MCLPSFIISLLTKTTRFHAGWVLIHKFLLCEKGNTTKIPHKRTEGRTAVGECGERFLKRPTFLSKASYQISMIIPCIQRVETKKRPKDPLTHKEFNNGQRRVVVDFPQFSIIKKNMQWVLMSNQITKRSLFIYIENFTTKKIENFQIKIPFFSYFCSRHRLGYSLEPPRRGGSI